MTDQNALHVPLAALLAAKEVPTTEPKAPTETSQVVRVKRKKLVVSEIRTMNGDDKSPKPVPQKESGMNTIEQQMQGIADQVAQMAQQQAQLQQMAVMMMGMSPGAPGMAPAQDFSAQYEAYRAQQKFAAKASSIRNNVAMLAQAGADPAMCQAFAANELGIPVRYTPVAPAPTGLSTGEAIVVGVCAAVTGAAAAVGSKLAGWW